MINLFTSNIAVDLVLRIWQRIPAPVVHNLEKAKVLKILFWHCAVDQLEGNYIEFGVAHGHSMRSAVEAERNTFSRTIGVKRVQRNLYGFDTFSLFQSASSLDEHATWEGNLYNQSLEKIRARFRKEANVFFVQCNAESLADGKHYVNQADFNIQGKSAIILFDMDLYSPTLSALRWAKQTFQVGTFLIFDEFFSFSGDANKGEALALSEFLNENQQIQIRDVSSYGAGGKVFVVSKC